LNLFKNVLKNSIHILWHYLRKDCVKFENDYCNTSSSLTNPGAVTDAVACMATGAMAGAALACLAVVITDIIYIGDVDKMVFDYDDKYDVDDDGRILVVVVAQA